MQPTTSTPPPHFSIAHRLLYSVALFVFASSFFPFRTFVLYVNLPRGISLFALRVRNQRNT